MMHGFPGGLDSKKKPACNAGDPGSTPGLERSPGERMANHSNNLAWRIHGQRSLVGYSLCGL